MNKEEKKKILSLAKVAFQTITPWKKTSESLEYDNGWNDCLKEIKKNRSRWLEKMENML